MRKANIVIVFCVFSMVSSFTQNDKSATDSLLLKQLEREMQATQPIQQPSSQTQLPPSSNPKISVVGDFQSAWRNNAKRNFSTKINEVEFAFQSVVDPYARADFFFSVEKDTATGKFEGGIEEGYLTTLSLPAHLQLKVGKFKSALGRINPIHSHALPFIEMPLAFHNFFGDGLADEGVSLSWLVPISSFYQEIVLEVTDGPSESPSFTRSDRNRYMTLAHLKNFWDITPNATLEIGLTGINGVNDSTFTTNIVAADITYIWKPVQFNTYKSFTWQTEILFSDAKIADNLSVHSWGMYSLMKVQIAKRWFLTGRFDYSNRPYSSNIKEQAYSLMAGWDATEFQKLEIEMKTITSNIDDSDYQVLFRWVFVIGSHGAHKY